MNPQLTSEMRDAIREHPDLPIWVSDPETQAKYVLLPAHTYEQIRDLLYDDTETDLDELLPLAHEAFRDDWDAQGMELYDDYDAHRS